VNVDVLLHDICTVDTDAVAAGFFEDVRPLKGAAGALDWLLCGALSRLVLENRLRGTVGEVALLTSSGKVPAGKVFLFGLGSREASLPGSLEAAARTVAASLAGAGVRRAVLDFFPLSDEADEGRLAAVRQGLREGAGGYALSISLLAHDPVSFERMSRALRP
jgi:hypothetical protein